MTTKEYLKKVLSAQILKDDSEEMKALDTHQARVEQLITEAFPDSTPSIEIGGSGAKDTRIRESYDLDMICYFPHEDTEPGDSLKEIYQNVKAALESEYFVQEKKSSLRLKGKSGTNDYQRNFHVDVVPGRYVDDTETDAYLHQTTGEKNWLKTNLRVHIRYVRKSGLLDPIRLMKFWNVRNVVGLKTFVLELAVIKLLADKKDSSLEKQLLHMWQTFKDDIDNLTVEDPANNNNDLKPLLDPVRPQLSMIAQNTLNTIESQSWEAVFGKVEENDARKTPGIINAAAAVSRPTRPWCSKM